MNQNQHKSNESVQDYLETIYLLSQTKAQVRSIDIATELSYSKPSVSVAMKNLRNNGYIDVSSEGYITLTESGHAMISSAVPQAITSPPWEPAPGPMSTI